MTLKWIGVVLGALIAIGLVVNAVFVWITDARLERQLAAIRDAGDPVRLADLARPPIPPEKNAATYLRRADADLSAIEKEVANRRPGDSMSAEDRKVVRAALAAYPKVLPLLEQAAACPDYDAELDYTLPAQEFLAKALDVVQRPRAAARVLHYQATLLVAEGKRDEAVRTALQIFRLASHFDRNPLVVSYLVSIAVRAQGIRCVEQALQSGPVSKEVREALDAELAAHERMEGFSRAMKNERAYSIESFRHIVPGSDSWLVGRAFWNMQESACLEVYPTLIELAGTPHGYRDIEQSIDSQQSVLARLLFPALKAAYGAVTRVRAEIRSLRVLNALQAHQPAEIGETPRLSDLRLPAATTTDPFNDKPLHVNKTPQGWLVYSVGPNLQDDGGKIDDPTNGDVGVGPRPPAKPAENDPNKS